MSIGTVAGDAALNARIRAAIRAVPDFPAPGILFRDVTPLLADGRLFRDVTTAMASAFTGMNVTHVAGVESRGFIFAAPVAQHLGAGFVPIRKKGKLPGQTVGRRYGLEYGSDELQMHRDACPPGSRVLIVDDVLATGGTAAASSELVEEIGASVVGFSFLAVLAALDGRARLGRYDIAAVLQL